MSKLIANFLLAGAWAAAIQPFNAANLAVGFALGYIVLWVASPSDRESPYFKKVFKGIGFAFFTLKELVVANIKMAVWTVMPLKRLRPMILAVPIQDDLTDTEITILSSLITLTPGTLTMDVSENRRYLFIHFMHVDDPEEAKRDVAEGFQRRLLEVTR